MKRGAGRLTRSAAENALLDFVAMRSSYERFTHGAADFLLADQIIRDFSAKLAQPTLCIWRARRMPAPNSRHSS
jgi:hypothetical protein